MPHAPLRAAAALALAVPVAAASLALAKAPDVTSGTVTLRTTDDKGTCAADPKSDAVNGVTCPSFPLYYSAPATGRPKGLVVFFHGHGHNGSQYAGQLADTARRYGVVAVAMQTEQLAVGQPSYRGPFASVDEEARDAASAIAWARARYRTGSKTYLFATSMGGSGLAYFLDAGTRSAQGDADATWVQAAKPFPLAGVVDAEGIASLAETWAEASAADPTSAAEIEKEAGGTPAAAPDAYRARSVALLTPQQLKATGLPVAAVIHDVDDGLVPYNQTFEARAAFAAAGVVTRTYEVLFKDACGQGNQTTATSYVPVPVDGQACLAGHANENDSSTPLMRTAFVALGELLSGQTGYDAQVVNPVRPTS